MATILSRYVSPLAASASSAAINWHCKACASVPQVVDAHSDMCCHCTSAIPAQCEQVMQHMSKCFQAIDKLKLDTDSPPPGTRPNGLGMVSCVGEEYVQFKKALPLEGKVRNQLPCMRCPSAFSCLQSMLQQPNLLEQQQSFIRSLLGYRPCYTSPYHAISLLHRCRLQVESYMNDIIGKMRSELRDYLHDSVMDYTKKPRDKWLFDWPSQIILVVNQIFWCQEVEQVSFLVGQKGKPC